MNSTFVQVDPVSLSCRVQGESKGSKGLAPVGKHWGGSIGHAVSALLLPQPRLIMILCCSWLQLLSKGPGSCFPQYWVSLLDLLLAMLAQVHLLERTTTV